MTQEWLDVHLFRETPRHCLGQGSSLSLAKTFMLQSWTIPIDL